jgi:hypothetical protein
MKTILICIILGMTLLLATTSIENNESITSNENNTIKKIIHIDFDKLKNDLNSTVYIKIDDKKVELYTISSNKGRGVEWDNDEVHYIISSMYNSDKICIDDDSIVKITLYNIKDEPIKNPNNSPKCFSIKKIQQDGYKFDIEDKNKATLSIYIYKDEKSKGM